MIKLLKCRFHFTGPLDMSRLCITCWDLWAELALDRNDLSREVLTEWKPIADGCFIPARQLDVRIAPDAISNVQLEEFQPSQNEILFHYASRSGNDASELLSLTGPSSLSSTQERSELPKCQAAALAVRWQHLHGTAEQGAEARTVIPLLLKPCIRMIIPCMFLSKVLHKAPSWWSNLGEGWKISFSFKPFLILWQWLT